MVEDMWVEGRAQMETYQLMQAGMMEARTSPVVILDWSASAVCGLCCCSVNTFTDKLNNMGISSHSVGAHSCSRDIY